MIFRYISLYGIMVFINHYVRSVSEWTLFVFKHAVITLFDDDNNKSNSNSNSNSNTPIIHPKLAEDAKLTCDYLPYCKYHSQT